AFAHPMPVAAEQRTVATTPPAGGVASRVRLEAIDVVRGVIMILMALDHTRDFFGIPGPSPTNLAQASAALFLTRWVTHFCAPVFIFLAGVSAHLAGMQGRGRRALASFLLARGLFLVVLEISLVGIAWFFNVRYPIAPGVVL